MIGTPLVKLRNIITSTYATSTYATSTVPVQINDDDYITITNNRMMTTYSTEVQTSLSLAHEARLIYAPAAYHYKLSMDMCLNDYPYAL